MKNVGTLIHAHARAHIYNFIKYKLKHVLRMVVTVPSFEIYGFIIHTVKFTSKIGNSR